MYLFVLEPEGETFLLPVAEDDMVTGEVDSLDCSLGRAYVARDVVAIRTLLLLIDRDFTVTISISTDGLADPSGVEGIAHQYFKNQGGFGGSMTIP